MHPFLFVCINSSVSDVGNISHCHTTYLSISVGNRPNSFVVQFRIHDNLNLNFCSYAFTEEDPSSSQPVCQIVTTNNERYLIITNTGQGDICIPITDENKDVLTLLQSFMKDSNEQGISFLSFLNKS